MALPGAAVKAIPLIIKMIDRFTDLTGRFISWLTLALVAITVIVVVLRYFFESGSIALQESITYLHGLIFMLGIAFTLQRGGHVRVDIFYRGFSPARKALVNLLGGILFLLPVSLLILFMSWDYVAASWSIGETSEESSGIAGIYLLKTLLLAMPATLLLQGVAEILKNILILMGKQPPEAIDYLQQEHVEPQV
jgi:TRAP-type mannitol/chloroaromatic compound transport system permease small subunit